MIDRRSDDEKERERREQEWRERTEKAKARMSEHGHKLALDPEFRYTRADATSVRKTFTRVRRERTTPSAVTLLRLRKSA